MQTPTIMHTFHSAVSIIMNIQVIFLCDNDASAVSKQKEKKNSYTAGWFTWFISDRFMTDLKWALSCCGILQTGGTTQASSLKKTKTDIKLLTCLTLFYSFALQFSLHFCIAYVLVKRFKMIKHPQLKFIILKNCYTKTVPKFTNCINLPGIYIKHMCEM